MLIISHLRFSYFHLVSLDFIHFVCYISFQTPKKAKTKCLYFLRMWDIFRIFTPVKEKVTDISKVLQDMTAEMRLMRETINQQYAEIAKLNRNIEALNRQIRKKDEENSILKPKSVIRACMDFVF